LVTTVRKRILIADAVPINWFTRPPGHAQPQKARPKRIADTGRSSQKAQNRDVTFPQHVITGQT
jgi:hypothetical protein